MELHFLTVRRRHVASASFVENRILAVGSSTGLSLPGEGIQPEHARLIKEDDGFAIEPVSDAPITVNGIPLAGRHRLQDGDWVVFGTAVFQVRIHQSNIGGKEPQSGRSADTQSMVSRRLVIGRLPTCDFFIPSPLISRRHAEMVWHDGRVILKDLHSTNGTFVNGQRLTEARSIEKGDRIQVGSLVYVFTGETLEPLDELNRIRIEAHGLGTEVKDRSSGRSKRLLDDVHLVIAPGEFVVIFGASGSGKSTLLDALSGRRPAGFGQLYYNGVDFYSSMDLFRTNMGYVPQQDIVHRKIQVRKALYYAGRLRLPGDTAREEIEQHTTRVLQRLGLSEKASSAIDTPTPLSGGQLKRVSLASELIANPSLLFLDEVTSGLDAGTDKKMMQLFAELAAEKKTIVCVTHTLENIDTCHLVLLVHKGRIIYFGPPKEALAYFGVSRLTEVYDTLEAHPAEPLAEKYRKSELFDEFVGRRYTTVREDPPREIPLSVRRSPPRFGTGLLQFRTLVLRYMDILLSDRRNSLLLLAQAPIIAVLIGLVFDISGPLDAQVLGESQVAFMVVLSAIWCGCLNSTREIVKELPIYMRERSVGLGIFPYLMSKLFPLSLLCVLQCIFLLGIVTVLCSWDGPFVQRLGVVVLTAVSAATMGLAVSTMVNSSDKAVAIVPVLLIPQVIFSNFVVTLGHLQKAVARGSVLAFSAFDAMKSLFSPKVQALVQVEAGLGVNVATISALAVASFVLAVIGLRWKDKTHRQ
ncbi:MAG: ATP-binding cassette domain-containing protein [Desulfacinum sp.]|nr:ATP-binding cassette domain-containing protein [Desulfacinum sp.]